MLIMIVKMSVVTGLYVLLTVLLWRYFRQRKITLRHKVLIGLIYGGCSVLSTHFGIDYSHMMLNVRDLGPLSAGLYFDPLSGIIAGLIGGIERYIAGTWWGVGSYTRIACSVSTCLAGFLSAFLNVCIFKHKKPSAVYGFFMGEVMEVFHMYVVFITHRNDMDMAFYVVKTCSPPMILFTGIGMAVSSTALKICAKEWKNPFRKMRDEEVPVSQKFQFWLFVVTASVLMLNLLFSFTVQTQTAVQNTYNTLTDVSGDIRETYQKLKLIEKNTGLLAEKTASLEAQALAAVVEQGGGITAVKGDFLEQMRKTFQMVAVTVVDQNGKTAASAGISPVYLDLLAEVLDGSLEYLSVAPSESLAAAGARCGDGMIQVVIDKNHLAAALNLTDLNEVLSFFHVGSEGTFDIIRDSGFITAGNHRGTFFNDSDLEYLKNQPEEVFFQTGLLGGKAICRIERLDDGLMLFMRLPMKEVYSNRDAQTYETAFADMLLFAVIYILISMLVQDIVVNNLKLVNKSLDKITHGDLNEVVSVRNSSEFASLSNDINQTVHVLKGYIEAAEKRFEQELEFARTIQDSALPKNFQFPRMDFEIFATMDPAKEVGGDFYDFFFIDQNKLVMVIADVSGKGIPAALFMMRAKTAIRGLAESGQEPSEILYKANNTLCEGNDAEMFVTVWLGIIDLQTGQMKCANAGHEYPALMRAGGEYELFKDKHSLALAAMEGMRFRGYEMKLDPGDRLFVYTDGIPEAINEAVEQYGPERLIMILNQVKNEKIQEILPAVRKDIADFAGNAEQFDDITMLAFSYFGQETVREERTGDSVPDEVKI